MEISDFNLRSMCPDIRRTREVRNRLHDSFNLGGLCPVISMVKKTVILAFIAFPILTHWNLARRFVEVNSDAGYWHMTTNDHVVTDALIRYSERFPIDTKIFIYKGPMFFYAVTGRTNPMYQTVLLQGFEYIENDKYQLLDNLIHCNVLLIAKYTSTYEMENGLAVDNELQFNTESFPDDFRFLREVINEHFEPAEESPYGYWAFIRK